MLYINNYNDIPRWAWNDDSKDVNFNEHPDLEEAFDVSDLEYMIFMIFMI